MKTALAIFFTLLYGIALIRPVYPIFDYIIKLEAYKAKCINKAVPEMHCDGKCILMQKLRALNVADTEPEAPVPPKVHLEDYLVGFLNTPPTYQVLSTTSPIPGTFQALFLPQEFVADLFQPPRWMN